MMNIVNGVVIILLLIVGFSQARTRRKFHFQRALMKIVGGTPAKIEEFPYQVSISYKNQFYCGGAILTNLTIVTGAHCVQPYEKNLDAMLIRAGSVHYGKNGVTAKVCSAFVHENYTNVTLDSDLALLNLCEPLPNHTAIGTIDLTTSKKVLNEGDEAIVTGWGRIKEGGPVSPALQKLVVPIIPFKDCVSSYKKKIKITRNMFCAGFMEGGRDACQGDSGGPLAMKGKLIGIISFGWKCAEKNFPGVYTRVSKYRHWIKSKIGI